MDLLSRAQQAFSQKPFKPHPMLSSAHAQTLGAYAWPRRSQLKIKADQERLFSVSPETKVLAHCHWQSEPKAHPTIIIWHGIEGSSSSIYMLAMALKGHRAGFNVVRVNLRNCGGTEHLTPTLYHGGLSEDLRAVIAELIEKDHLTQIVAVGFSLGGNMVLKLGGEYGPHYPKELIALAAVSPSIDLNASAESIGFRSNWIYHRDFLRRLRNRLKRKEKLYPDLYDTSELHLVRTLREFDDRYTSRAHGFSDVADYYFRASAIRVIDRISLPTLIIHSHDDPFIPFGPLLDPAVTNNPNILLIDPARGGHVAFLSAKVNDEDRFWAENRVIEFSKLAVSAAPLPVTEEFVHR